MTNPATPTPAPEGLLPRLDEKRWGDAANALACASRGCGHNVTTVDYDRAEAAIREVAERQGLKLGKVAQPLRAALTGRTTSPGIFDVLVLLGQGESLARIEDQMMEQA